MSNQNQALSKETIYAPLSSYLDTTTKAKELPAIPQQNDPFQAKTKLYTLLINLSKHYNGHMPSKVLRENTLDSRLMQRTLTLVSGGINNSLNSANKRKRKREYTVSNTHRKKKAKEINNESNTLPRNIETQEVLSSMNNIWKNYMQKAIRDCQDIKQASSRLSNIELGGAYIRILSCKHNSKIIGKNGVILEESKCTWNIAITDYDDNCKKNVIQVVRIPKDGASLAFRVDKGLLSERCSKSCGNGKDEMLVVINGPEKGIN